MAFFYGFPYHGACHCVRALTDTSQLGVEGAFLKVAQALSARPDLLPEVWIGDLSRLQDAAPPVRFEEIRGVADAKATEIYASAYNKSPEAVTFYEFTRTMQSYKSIIADNTTLVLSTDSDLFKFLKGMSPDLDPAQASGAHQ